MEPSQAPIPCSIT